MGYTEELISCAEVNLARQLNPVKIANFTTFDEHFDQLHSQNKHPVNCTDKICCGNLHETRQKKEVPLSGSETISDQATDFLNQYYSSKNMTNSTEHQRRLIEVFESIFNTGSYDLTTEELTYGAKLAWRNTPKSIGRVHWDSLQVFDCRHVKTTDEMFEALCQHLKYATQDGNLRPAITVFPKRQSGKSDFRVWNRQLISYAGYVQEDCTVVGDPAEVKMTEVCGKLGWRGNGGHFDVLPLVLSASGEDPKYYEIPKELILEVQIKHPEYDWFDDLGLMWYALPTVSDKLLDIGGLQFTAAPYNEPYHISSEIGCKAFCDPHRYNILEEVAIKMNLDTSNIISLWKDQAAVEINIAILNSFQEQQVSILDHHSASEIFIQYLANEQTLRGGSPADWNAINPAINSGITSLFHQEMISYNLKPNIEQQDLAWKTHVWVDKNKEKQHHRIKKFRFQSVARAIMFSSYMMKKYTQNRIRVAILYASETGKSESYANRIKELFQKSFNPTVHCMEDYPMQNLHKEPLTLIITSTFGSGEAPDNGKVFNEEITKMVHNTIDPNNNVFTEKDTIQMKSQYIEDHTADISDFRKSRFAVFALGSSAYPDFCAFGKYCDKSLAALGCQRLLPVATGDEVTDQERSFKNWAYDIFEASCSEFGIRLSSQDSLKDCLEDDKWSPESYRLSRAGEQQHDLYKGLAQIHHKAVTPCKMLSRKQLQSADSSRRTILVRLTASGEESMTYESGDHLGIFPTNQKELVTGISKRLTNISNLNDVVNILTVDKERCQNGRVKAWKNVGRLPPCSIMTALYHYLDITTPPTQKFLKLVSKTVSDNKTRVQLENLANDDDYYNTWKNYKYPNLLEVLEEFPAITVDAVLLLTQLPLLQPRFYSISSAPGFYQGEIHATVGVVQYQTQDGSGPTHFGLCTSFLDSFPQCDIPCFIRKAPNFHLPVDKARPMIMVGPGTGIAPFRSFWQHRLLEKRSQQNGALGGIAKQFGLSRLLRSSKSTEEFGQMVLYFGCRHPQEDDVYQKELMSVQKEIDVFRTRTAYSRLTKNNKVYVQNLLQQDHKLIYDLLVKEKGHFYVCGEAGMAAEVRTVLKTIFNKYEDTLLDSDTYLQTMKNEGRFHEDIFNVLIKSK